eukprot:CAMPEP_0201898088 /NCGR_PEP_ID=MMETSP0902-20130614/47842_1 /ASSEMBLY_ACC=CAM_ASM_000551 /TAXON_ID=420261 /ORGANISM="Thalassiosira antarctica, Strain CCMP982" /LENGTH=75 /DNA_ID=CAMNT_0048431135 /DNA_START=6 /DNA_END=229 /DNA_ORIENTATION=+
MATTAMPKTAAAAPLSESTPLIKNEESGISLNSTTAADEENGISVEHQPSQRKSNSSPNATTHIPSWSEAFAEVS